MAQQLVYDPRFHTFVSWACLMVELYAEQQLEIPNETTDWKSWGRGLLAIGFFANEAVPIPDQFEQWDDWAAALMGAMNA